MKTINIEAVRKDTPATQELIHFNNAGASLAPNSVIKSVIDYTREEATLGGYEAEAKYSEHFKKIYQSIATLINCSPSEIALVESATRAWDVALSSIIFSKGDVILTTETEYISNYIALLQIQKRYEVQIELIANDSLGQFSLEDLKKKIHSKTKLVALTHVPSTNGLINPIEEASSIIKQHKAYFLLDACQSVGQLVIDVKKINCDFLAATGRKFLRAPRGTGFLFVKSSAMENLEPHFLDFTSATLSDQGYQTAADARRYENYETNFAARYGLGVAVNYLLDLGQNNVEARVKNLAKKLRSELVQIPELNLLDTGINKSGIVTFNIAGCDSKTIAMELRKNKINVSTSSPAFALELQKRQIPSLVRASVHYYNTEEEIHHFVEYLSRAHFNSVH